MNLSDALFVVTMQVSRWNNERSHDLFLCGASLEHTYVFLYNVYTVLSSVCFPDNVFSLFP